MSNKERQKKWDKAHPEKRKEYAARYREKHQDKVKDREANWRKAHPEKRKEYAARYREKNQERLKLEQRERRQQLHYNSGDRQYRASSVRTFLSLKLGKIKKEKHSKKITATCNVPITLDYLVALWEKQDGKCAVSGKQLIHAFSSPYTVSIDRIDSNIGYFEGNVQLVCQSINFAKNGYTAEEFLYFWNHQSPE